MTEPLIPSAQEASAPTPQSTANKSPETSALETLALAYLRDQRKANRWRWVLRWTWVLLVAVFLWSLLHTGDAGKATNGPHTAVVEIKGEIADGTEASAANIVAALHDAFEDSNAQALVLLINSPGGSPVQAGIINDEIARMKVLYKKPVFAVVEETCASAAYYIAVSADAIYVDKASIVGSIGVLMDGFGFTGLMDKLGVERRLMTAGANKGFLDPFSPQSPKQREYAQAMLDQIHQQFIAVVRQGRGKRLKEEADTFSGLFWSGEQAVKMGLADHLGNLDFVAREVIKAPELLDYTRKENVAERLAKRFGMAVGEGAVKAIGPQAVHLR